MERKQKKDFIKEMKVLFSDQKVISNLKYKILEINEENFGEYYLTLDLNNECIIEGIYIKTKISLKIDQIIDKCIFILDKFKSEIQIKEIFSTLSCENNNIDFKKGKEDIPIFNLYPKKILSFFYSIKCFKHNYQYDNIFIVIKSEDEDEFILKNPITQENYTIKADYLKNIDNLKAHDFLYLKNFLYNDNDEIIFINLTTVQKASDYIIFKKLDKYISNYRLKDVYELKPLDEKKISAKFLYSKVVLKNINEKLIIIMDKFNRLIELDYNKFINLDLFDLIFITDCEIEKSKKDEMFYSLYLKDNSLCYSTKELIYNKNISINNYTILDIRIPDFYEKDKYFDKIIISNNNELDIKTNRIVYIFKFINEQFNEIVPYKLLCLYKSKKYEFKFLIIHNLINNINLFLNYNGDRCCIDHCYWNFVGKAPESYKLLINQKKYEINHYNSFDSFHRVGFILVNVPATKQTNRIKNTIKNKSKNIIINSQIWYINNFISKQEYKINQILNIDEAKPKKYLNYKSKIKNYSKYKNLFDVFNNFRNNWNKKQNEIYNYYKDFNENIYKFDEIEINSFIYERNTNFDSDSADFNVLKIYISILLFHSLKTIEVNNKKSEIINKWHTFIICFFDLLDKLIELKDEITAHEKIRILSSFVFDFFDPEKEIEKPCKFLYLNGKNIDEKNSYLLAIKFNKDVINNLTEISALTKGYIQIDSFILKNYFLEEIKKSYTFSNEPISLMKYHLLINYDNFIFINYKKQNNNYITNAEYDYLNRITIINELGLFNDDCSEYFIGKNKAFPISIENFHEKDSHAKKDFKNSEIESPAVCYVEKTIVRKSPENGKFIESIIGKQSFIRELKDSKNNLGDLMDTKYFVDKDFKKLHEKYDEVINSNKKKKIDKNSENKNKSDLTKLKKDKTISIEMKNNNQENIKYTTEDSLETLEDFENAYLVNGYFVYPDSIPIHEYAIGEEPKPISKGEQEYLDKYRPIIEEAMISHLYTKKIK